MNESQKRREEMLKEARAHYQRPVIPAVHPRYRSIYRNLYENDLPKEPSGSFFARLFISFLIFAMFAAADYTGEKIWKYTPSQIVSEIQYQPDFSGYLQKAGY